jgi:hypothetical protein
MFLHYSQVTIVARVLNSGKEITLTQEMHVTHANLFLECFLQIQTICNSEWNFFLCHTKTVHTGMYTNMIQSGNTLCLV